MRPLFSGAYVIVVKKRAFGQPSVFEPGSGARRRSQKLPRLRRCPGTLPRGDSRWFENDGRGRYRIGVSGWGLSGQPRAGRLGVLISHDGVDKELFGSEAQTTNNRMELLAARFLLATGTWCGRLRFIPILNTSAMVSRSGCLTGKRMGGRPQAETGEESGPMEAVGRTAAGRAVEWYWVRGHSGHPGNERADALANHAIDSLLTG